MPSRPDDSQISFVVIATDRARRQRRSRRLPAGPVELVLIPMLDLSGAADPVADYLRALRTFDGLAGDVEVVVPGHGSVGGADEVRARVERDRAYLKFLGEGDPRLGPSATFGKEWLSGVHERQLRQLGGVAG